jgi:hypothetical protein
MHASTSTWGNCGILEGKAAKGPVVVAIETADMHEACIECRLTEPLKFSADEASVTVHTEDCEYACDGEQTVDILCRGGEQALAIEAKLGETRMKPAEFKASFCLPREISRHSDSRLRAGACLLFSIVRCHLKNVLDSFAGLTTLNGRSPWNGGSEVLALA